MAETQLSRSIQKELTKLGIWWIRIQSGTHRVRGGMLHCAEPGTPDLCLPALGWLEIKLPGSEPSSVQLSWHSRAVREGLRVAVVRSVGEAVAVARRWEAEARSGQLGES